MADALHSRGDPSQRALMLTCCNPAIAQAPRDAVREALVAVHTTHVLALAVAGNAGPAESLCALALYRSHALRLPHKG